MIRALTFGRYADDNFGGLERYVFELARGLRNEVHYTNIVARRGGAPDLEVIGETVHARPWAELAGTCLALALMRGGASAAIHWRLAREIASLPGALGGLAALAAGRAWPRPPRPVRALA